MSETDIALIALYIFGVIAVPVIRIYKDTEHTDVLLWHIPVYLIVGMLWPVFAFALVAVMIYAALEWLFDKLVGLLPKVGPIHITFNWHKAIIFPRRKKDEDAQ